MPNIVVGVDGSEGAAVALRWAVDEARVRGADLVAVLAWGYLNEYPSDAFTVRSTDVDAAAALDAMLEAALGPTMAGAVERRPVRDLPFAALLDASEDADLLVVGARGLGGFRGLLLGSVSLHCVHHATVPTAVVRDVPARANGRIVVGMSASPAAAEVVLRWAVDEARRRRASLTVVHAYPPLGPGGPFSAQSIDPSIVEDAAERAVLAALSEIDTAGVEVTPMIVCASAAGAVVDASPGADLVVVGSRGLGATRRLLLGSVATQVVHHAHAPLVIVPTSTRGG